MGRCPGLMACRPFRADTKTVQLAENSSPNGAAIREPGASPRAVSGCGRQEVEAFTTSPHLHLLREGEEPDRPLCCRGPAHSPALRTPPGSWFRADAWDRCS